MQQHHNHQQQQRRHSSSTLNGGKNPEYDSSDDEMININKGLIMNNVGGGSTNYNVDQLGILQNSSNQLKQSEEYDDEFDGLMEIEEADQEDQEAGGEEEEEVTDLEGLEPARKLNKGTILAKSIEYIKFLEMKNERMKQEHDELVLKARMLGLVIDEDM